LFFFLFVIIFFFISFVFGFSCTSVFFIFWRRRRLPALRLCTGQDGRKRVILQLAGRITLIPRDPLVI
jgi:hypothetical protein